jgi:uncharacterized protein
MLISFSVSNFRSFFGEQTLSMVASNRQPDHPEHLNPIPEDENQALPVAVIYGANGAGKSNLVKALGFLQGLVTKGTEPKRAIGRKAFLLNRTAVAEPTEWKVQFAENGLVYAFGVKVNDRVVLEEWLSVVRDGKEIPVYERVTGEGEDVVIEAGEVLKDDTWGRHEKALALTRVGVLPNQLFLYAAGNNLKPQDQGPVIAGALGWFQERLQIIQPDATFGDLAGLVARDSSFTDFAGDFLRRVATGVERLQVETADIDEKMLVGLSERLSQHVADLPEGETRVMAGPDGSQLIIEKGEGTRVKVRTIRAEHLTADGGAVELPFSEESDGTQRLTHLLPALHSICGQAGVWVIDEIDRSLHPLLAKGFVRAFLKACAGRGGQLIFTTHELAFMDLELLRRDEIWFASKRRPEGSTELYSLSDYKVRTDLRVDRAYLQGRFEAIPPIEAELPGWVREIMEELKAPVTPTEEAGA